MGAIRGILVSAVLVLVAGCASTGLNQSGLMIDGIEIVNSSSSDIEGFRLEVPRSGAVVSTNRILEGRSFLNGVEPFPYQGNAVSLHWLQDGQKYTVDGLKLREVVDADAPVTVVVELHDFGGLNAYVR